MKMKEFRPGVGRGRVRGTPLRSANGNINFFSKFSGINEMAIALYLILLQLSNDYLSFPCKKRKGIKVLFPFITYLLSKSHLPMKIREI